MLGDTGNAGGTRIWARGGGDGRRGKTIGAVTGICGGGGVESRCDLTLSKLLLPSLSALIVKEIGLCGVAASSIVV